MVPTQDSEENNDCLLLNYLDGNFRHQTSCVLGDVKVHRFSYDIYIDVMLDNYWSDNITIHEAFEKSLWEFVVGDDYKHLSEEALLAAIQAFFFPKA